MEPEEKLNEIAKYVDLAGYPSAYRFLITLLYYVDWEQWKDDNDWPEDFSNELLNHEEN